MVIIRCHSSREHGWRFMVVLTPLLRFKWPMDDEEAVIFDGVLPVTGHREAGIDTSGRL